MTADGAGPPVARAAQTGDAALALGRRRRTPYRILALVQVFAALLCLVFAVPGVTQHQAPAIYLSVAAALIGLAALTWWLLPLLPDDYGIDVALALGYLMAGATTLMSPTDEGQVLIGLGLTMYAVSAAYFLPRPRVRASVILLALVYGAAALLNPLMSSPAVYGMVVAVNVALAMLVGRLVQRLRDLALHDALTGLLNRHGLDLLAPPLLAACSRSGIAVTVGLIDLDHFKRYNDTHGHLAGDRLLQQVAQAWTTELRESDLAARFGGDEFAIVLVDTGLDAAGALQARVRAAFGDGSAEAGPWTVGWAHVAPGEPLYAALDRADVELFAAKAARGSARA